MFDWVLSTPLNDAKNFQVKAQPLEAGEYSPQIHYSFKIRSSKLRFTTPSSRCKIQRPLSEKRDSGIGFFL